VARGGPLTQVRELTRLTRQQLREAFVRGRPVPDGALDDTEFHGVALGLPGWVEALSWKTFKKVFRRDRLTGRLHGWNAAVVQAGVDGPYEDRRRGGRRLTYGHYEVRPAAAYGGLGGLRGGVGVVIDYGLGGNAWWDVSSRLKDPLVALDDDGALLLGYSVVDLGAVRLDTPTWFVLQRGGPLTYDVAPARRLRR
jgi:hypothetical protein